MLALDTTPLADGGPSLPPSQDDDAFALLRHFPLNTYPGAQGAAIASNGIVQLKEKIKATEQQLQALQVCLLQHQSLLSPAAHIPDDILLLIFFYHIHGSGDPRCPEPQTDANFHSSSPLALSQVCSRWRSLVMNTSSLWSGIFFDYHTANKLRTAAEHDALQRFQTQLDNSKNAPLRMALFRWGVAPGSISQADGFVGKSMPRWKEASLSGLITPQVMQGFPPPEERFPLLEKLTLKNTKDSFNCCWAIPGMFEVAPMLRHLTLDCVNLSVADAQLPWTQLTELRLHNVQSTSSVFFDVLAACQNVVRLALDLTFHRYRMIFGNQTFSDSSPSDQETIILPRLEDLTFQDIAHPEFVEFCSRIRLPSLQEVTFSTGMVRIHARLFAELLKASGCTVKKLRVLDAYPEYAFKPILEALEELECLEFGMKPRLDVNVDQLLLGLTMPAGSRRAAGNSKSTGSGSRSTHHSGALGLCPNLKRFTLRSFSVTPSFLQDMLLSRCQPGAGTDEPGPVVLQFAYISGVNFVARQRKHIPLFSSRVYEEKEPTVDLDSLMDTMKRVHEDGVRVVVRSSIPQWFEL